MTALRLDEKEARLLGVLIEKELTTPDAYPLTANALRVGANQKSNREPAVDYGEADVEAAAAGLVAKGLAERVSGARVERWRHLAGKQLALERPALAVLAELLLRGPQAPGELRARASRMAPLETLYDLGLVLAELEKASLARRVAPSPGSRSERWRERLTWGTDVELAAVDARAPRTPEEVLARHDARATLRASGADEALRSTPAPAAAAEAGLEQRVAALEAKVLRLERALEGLLGN